MDFRSLVELCHAIPPIYPPEENPSALRIQSYIERFRELFTTELYHWYIERGKTYMISMFVMENQSV